MFQKKDRLISFYVFLMDAIVIAVSYFAALRLYPLVFGAHSINDEKALITTLIAFVLTEFIFGTNKYIAKRDRIEELFSVMKQSMLLVLFVAAAAMTLHIADEVSRMVLLFTVVLYFILDLLLHLLLKSMLKRSLKKNGNHILLVTKKEQAEKVISDVNTHNRYGKISAIAVVDEELTGKEIAGIPVVADKNTMFDYAKRDVVDEVLLFTPYAVGDSMASEIREFESMGIVVHVALQELEEINEYVRTVSEVGTYPVITFSQNVMDVEKAVVKRIVDILAGIVGSIICLILFIFVAPAIYIESPGPIFFKQKRVGRNGRFFYMFKFRSMYPDAEKRKAELMAKNEMNGLMFKVTDDPRITKVGKFIRATSIDEFPQFFNILKGDMSLIGTRPPTVDEFKQYEEHHKSRLAMKPGLTGMWQASGRSDITDFEEVVKLDCYYINNWSLTLDLKIFFKTIISVLGRKGSK